MLSAETTTDSHSNEEDTTTDGKKNEVETTTDDHSNEVETTADGHSNEVETTTDGHSNEEETTTDGHSNEVKTTADGHSNEVETTTDGHSNEEETTTNGHSNGVETTADGHSNEVEATSNGQSNEEQTTKDGHSNGEEFYNAARDGDVDYITSKLAQGNNNSSSNRIKSLLTWCNEINHNETALHVAAKEGHEPVVLALIKAGASPDVKEGHGRTPLHLAAIHDQKEVYTALLEAGASPDVEDKDGMTPVHVTACFEFYHAAYEGDIDYITSKLAEGNNNESLLTWCDETIHNQTALHVAAMWSNRAVALALIKAGASPGVKEAHGWTPLHMAAFWGDKELYAALLEAGASPDVEDDDGMTPVQLAAYLEFYCEADDGNIDYITSKLAQGNNSSGMIKMLLTWHSEFFNKETALHAAAKKSHVPVVLALLTAGASPTAKESLYKRTPVHSAAGRGLIEVLTALLEAGGSPNVEDEDGKTPVHVAAEDGRAEALSTLLQPQYQANINQQDNEGRTPVYCSIRYGSEALPVLIENGADVNIASYSGSLARRTPLMEGIRWEAETLINAGARLDDADDEGLTALHYATREYCNWEEVVRLLLRNGADKSIRDKQGRTPADLAREEGHNDLAEFIDNWQ